MVLRHKDKHDGILAFAPVFLKRKKSQHSLPFCPLSLYLLVRWLWVSSTERSSVG